MWLVTFLLIADRNMNQVWICIVLLACALGQSAAQNSPRAFRRLAARRVIH